MVWWEGAENQAAIAFDDRIFELTLHCLGLLADMEVVELPDAASAQDDAVVSVDTFRDL